MMGSRLVLITCLIVNKQTSKQINFYASRKLWSVSLTWPVSIQTVIGTKKAFKRVPLTQLQHGRRFMFWSTNIVAATTCQLALYYNTGGVDGRVCAAVKGMTF